MSFRDDWRPRIDGIDELDSSAVNEIAEELIRLGNEVASGGGSADLSNYVTRDEFTLRVAPIEHDINNIYEGIGEIDIALDTILSMQNEFIGGAV